MRALRRLLGGWFFATGAGKVDLLGGRYGRDRVLENRLHRLVVAAQQDHVLVKRFDLADQFDAIDQKHRAVHMFLAQGVEKNVLKILALAHVYFV